MKIILLGAPGSGKGTQGQKLSELRGFHVITASSLLREASKGSDALGQKIRSLMDAGKLVTDEVVWELTAQEVDRVLPENNQILLDGFPRSMEQLAMLNTGKHDYDHLVYLNIDPEVVIERICGRRVHLPSGRVYHINYAPPKVAGKDDVTGEDLVHRPDDQREVVEQRLITYAEKTLPIVSKVRQQISQGEGRIKNVIVVDANQPIPSVTESLIDQL